MARSSAQMKADSKARRSNGSSSNKTEQQLIEEMRQQGREYLKKKPQTFGGGIDPQTGIRTVEGERVSVLTRQEEAA